MRAFAGVLLPLALLGACQIATPTPYAVDSGRNRRDGAEAPRIDTDRDGLCDDTETDLRSDAERVDTDGDGLIDSFEYQLGSDILSSRDPPLSERLLLREEAGATVVTEQVLDYRSIGGEVVSGAVLDRVRGLDERAASEFTASTVLALDANPAGFVLAANENRFVGVTGRVALHWRVTFELATAQLRALGCRRAYGVLFVAKREGDQIVANRSLVIEVAPNEGDGDAGATSWGAVDPDGLCLPRAPCL